jgi:hypothetical protein
MVEVGVREDDELHVSRPERGLDDRVVIGRVDDHDRAFGRGSDDPAVGLEGPYLYPENVHG